MRILTTWAALLSLIFPTGVTMAEGPAPIAQRTEALVLRNVELSESGSLSGQYVGKSGQPVANAEIQFTFGDVVTKVTSDKNGRFEANNLTPGKCVVQIGDATYACRLWLNGTAPPKSLTSIAIVAEEATVLGNNWQPGYRYPHRLHMLTSNQKLALGVLAAGGTAIAIAVSQDDGSKPNAS